MSRKSQTPCRPLTQLPIVVDTSTAMPSPQAIAGYINNLQQSPDAVRNRGIIVRTKPGDGQYDILVQIGGETFPARPHAHRLDARRTGWVMLGCVRTRSHREHLRTVPGAGKSRVTYVLAMVHNASPLAIAQRVVYMTPACEDTVQLARFALMEQQFYAR